jgi:hypothetical protein
MSRTEPGDALLPRLIPPAIRAHIQQLIEDTTTHNGRWMTVDSEKNGTASKLMRLRERFTFPEKMQVPAVAGFDSLVDALLRDAIDTVPIGTEKMFPTFERLARDSPCSMRVPTKIRMENMFERCGVTLLLACNLKDSLTTAALDGTLNDLHFPEKVSYKDAHRSHSDSNAVIASTPLSSAVEDIVSKFILDPGSIELVRLLSGYWPYGRYLEPERSTVWAFDTLMGLFCRFVKEGSILYRLERSHMVVLSCSSPSSSAPTSSYCPSSFATPLCTFQQLALFGDSSDLLIVGHHEGRNRWGVHGDSNRFGIFTAKLGQGTYAIVAGYLNLKTIPNRYAVRFQKVPLLTRRTELTEESSLNRFLAGIAGTHIAMALTRLVSPYDGYIDGEGSVHAASIARLYDHQLVAGSLADMVPEMVAKGSPEDVPRVWQIDVYEQIVGVSVNDAIRNQSIANPIHEFYTSLVVQVLACVRSFGRRARFSHCDLTLNNILLCQCTDLIRGRSTLLYRGHNTTGDLYIPLSHSSGMIAKVIDYSLACAATPENGPIFSPDSSMISCQRYNPELDMHVLACRLLYTISFALRAPHQDERLPPLQKRSDAARFASLNGVTAVTLRMLSDMLIKPENVLSASPDSKEWTELAYTTFWNDEKGNHGVIIPRSAVVSAFHNHTNGLRDTLAIFSLAIDAYLSGLAAGNTEHRLMWPKEAHAMGKKLRSDAINSCYTACCCTFSTNEEAIERFLMTPYFDQFRTPIREGVLVMNETATS